MSDSFRYRPGYGPRGRIIDPALVRPRIVDDYTPPRRGKNEPTPIPAGVAARFWLKVDRRGPDECWPWKGSFYGSGYGRLIVAGISLAAHRVSYRIAGGVDPGDMYVCHSCDNPRCCNPAHLFASDHAGNMADRAQKGRTYWGSRSGADNPAAKLTPEAVAAVRRAILEGIKLDQIARDFGVSISAISLIKRGKTWKPDEDKP